MIRAILATLLLCALSLSAEAKPSRHISVTEFNGDRYVLHMAHANEVTREIRKSKPRKSKVKRKPRPGHVSPLTLAHRRALPSKSLVGVVAPLATKARAIEAICGSHIISSIRHTYIAGTGGRLSLHASGRAVDIAGNPSCIYAQLRGWPGGVSIDYGRVQHVHFSYAPHGAEWGTRFNHYRGGRRHRHAHRRA